MSDKGDDFWTNGGDQLHMCSINQKSGSSIVTCRQLDLTTQVTNFWPRLFAYDGNTNIFLTDLNKTIHLLTTNGQYNRQLLSAPQVTGCNSRITIDKEHQLLYVLQDNGTVSVFKLTYDNVNK
jgi:hypothetical protein